MNSFYSDEPHLNKTDIKILKLLQENQFLTAKEMAEELMLTPRTIQRSLQKLILNEQIKRIGSKKTGHWEVIK